MSLAPPIKNVKGNFTQRALSLSKPGASTASKQFGMNSDNLSNSNLPQVNASFYNTHAVMQEYGQHAAGTALNSR